MCLIIDTCCFANVFNPNNHDHAHFKPVLIWITQGKGKLIYGGKRYKSELSKCVKYFSLLTQLTVQGRVITLNDDLVDDEEGNVLTKESNPDFDDPHLIAIAIVSRCRLICTNDKSAHKYIKKNSLYPKGIKKPSIYSSINHTNLLVNQNIVDICM